MGDLLGFLFLMTPVFYAVFFVGVPVAAAWWAWRRWPSRAARTASVLGGVVLFGALVWFAQHEKWDADRQVRELCAKDGGVKVYEQVKLPAERFDKYGVVRIPSKEDARAGDEYYYENRTTFLREGNPSLRRSYTQLVRRADGRMFGEAISYHRVGGDLPGPWHSSSFACPKPVELQLGKAVFVMEMPK